MLRQVEAGLPKSFPLVIETGPFDLHRHRLCPVILVSRVFGDQTRNRHAKTPPDNVNRITFLGFPAGNPCHGAGLIGSRPSDWAVRESAREGRHPESAAATETATPLASSCLPFIGHITLRMCEQRMCHNRILVLNSPRPLPEDAFSSSRKDYPTGFAAHLAVSFFHAPPMALVDLAWMRNRTRRNRMRLP